jgi:hypothetical protein
MIRIAAVKANNIYAIPKRGAHSSLSAKKILGISDAYKTRKDHAQGDDLLNTLGYKISPV